jgi:hypothetical protein
MGLGLGLGGSAHFQVCFALQPKASAGILNKKERAYAAARDYTRTMKIREDVAEICFGDMIHG